MTSAGHTVSRILGLSLRISLFTLCLYFLVTPVEASTSLNVTIDDTFEGDSSRSATLTYLPTAGNQWNIGQDCAGCYVQPSIDSAYNGSWHDSTAEPSRGTDPVQVTFNFTGTALYVYCILANNITDTDTSGNYSFSMDGSSSGPNFVHTPSDTPDYQYNALVYSKENMDNTFHSFTLTSLDGGQPSLLLFDYLVYTQLIADSDVPNALNTSHPNSSNSTSPPSSLPPSSLPSSTSNRNAQVAAIVGGLFGGLAVLSVLVVIIFTILRKKRKRRDVSEWGDDANVRGRPLNVPQRFSANVTVTPFAPPTDPDHPHVAEISVMKEKLSEGFLHEPPGFARPSNMPPMTQKQQLELQRRVVELEQMIEQLTSGRGAGAGPAGSVSKQDHHPASNNSPDKILRDNTKLQEQVRKLRNEMQVLRERARQSYLPSPGGSEQLPDYTSLVSSPRRIIERA